MTKILIADDEPLERESLLRMVNGIDGSFEVRSVENGRQAVVNATLWKADLILMDIEMPGLNGLEAAREIIGQNPRCKVIFITAYPLFVYALDAIKLGASDYILKPVEEESVRASVRKVCSQIESERKLVSLHGEVTGDDRDSGLLISHVVNYIDSNFTRYDISLDSVADIVGLNPSYLSALFKRGTGVNFTNYISDKRISAAKELLKDPLRSAGEIASLTGYESASYFTRAFKKKTGMTPTEYRKSLGKAGGDI